MRKITALVALGLAGALAGCVGDTGEAQDVRATQATLTATGHTNNGPGYWWWEWGTTRKGVGNGQGTKTPKQGPAASASDVTVTQTLSARWWSIRATRPTASTTSSTTLPSADC
jgi:hypothetical protein